MLHAVLVCVFILIGRCQRWDWLLGRGGVVGGGGGGGGQINQSRVSPHGINEFRTEWLAFCIP